MEGDLGSVLNTCPREGTGEIHPWALRLQASLVQMEPPGALPSLGWGWLSPEHFPALPEKRLAGVRKVIWGFLGCFSDSWVKISAGSVYLLIDDGANSMSVLGTLGHFIKVLRV